MTTLQRAYAIAWAAKGRGPTAIARDLRMPLGKLLREMGWG